MRKSTHSREHDLLRSLLRDLRAGAGLSQRALALKLRLPHTWVAKIESGERRLDLIEFGWFCSACGLDPAEVSARLFAATTKARAAVPRRSHRRGPKSNPSRGGGQP